MSDWDIIRTSRLTDRQVVELINLLIVSFKGSTSSIWLAAAQNQTFIYEDMKQLIGNQDRQIVRKFQFSGPENAFHVSFRKGISSGESGPDNNRQPSPFYDEIWIKISANISDKSSKFQSQHLVLLYDNIRQFVSYKKNEKLNELAQDSVSALQAEFQSLNSMFSAMSASVEERRNEIEALHLKQLEEVEEERRRAKAEIEKERQTEANSLKAKEETLKEREKAIDDRDHMHARRQLRDNITEEVQSRLQNSLVPKTAAFWRYGILFASLVGCFIFGTISIAGANSSLIFGDLLASLGGSSSAEATAVSAISAAKGLFAAALSIAFGVYAINWMRRIYHEDVDAHRELERYSLDINRASWVVETIMEAQSIESLQLPSNWIEGATKNLFETSRRGESEVMNNALAALLDASAKAEIGPGGAKFEMNGRGTRKLAKAIEE